MKKALFSILGIIVTLTNCDNDNIVSGTLFTHKQITQRAYSSTYMYPAGFNYEQGLEGSVYYENTVSVRRSENSWIELSTDDRQQSKDWSEIASSTSAYYRDLVSEKETDKFFEFKRVYSARPSDILLSRIHKSSYFIPTYDKFKRGSQIGVLKTPVINRETFKEFVEYAWTNYLIGYTEKVLENSIIDNGDNVHYNLKSVNVIYGDWGICDAIEVRNFDFYVDKASGVMTFESSKIKTIQGTCR